MCKCGCNTCGTNEGPLLTEGKVKSLLSEGLQYHIDKKIPLFETVYRIGSNKHLSLIKEARKMYSRNVINLCEEDEALIKTHLGEFALYEGESVPLDLPMLEESNMPSQEEVNKFFSDTQQEIHYLNNKPVKDWDEYDMSNWKSKLRKKELGRPQFSESDTLQEKLKGIDGKACWKGYKLAGTKKKGGKTVDNCVPMEEAKQDIYDKFLDNPSSPKGRAKSLILKFTKEYGDGASSMAVDRFASKNNLKPEEKYILKYITKNDIKISSQSGGPDFSAVSEAEFKGKEVPLGKPKRGGPKAYYVYVKDGDKVKKVTFGSGGLRAKIKNKDARNAFAARHNCKDKKDRTTPGYWSCNLPRYAQALGLGANMNTFW
jgi:hypothetical protein